MNTQNWKDNSKRNYRHWCNKLLEFTGRRSIREVTQADIDRFFAWMVRPMGYGRNTVNQAKIAIKHFAAADGVEFEIGTVSTRPYSRRPEIIGCNQAAQIIDALTQPYQNIAKMIYYECVPPGVACSQFESRLSGINYPVGTTVAPATLNRKLQEAARYRNVLMGISGKSLQQSGIVSAFRNGVERDWLMEQAGIGLHQLAYYEKLAGRIIE